MRGRSVRVKICRPPVAQCFETPKRSTVQRGRGKFSLRNFCTPPPCSPSKPGLGLRYLMSIRHSLMRFATPRFREKFTCTFVGTGRNVRYAFLHILPVLQPWWDFPGNYCWRELLLGTHGPSHELEDVCSVDPSTVGSDNVSAWP